MHSTDAGPAANDESTCSHMIPVGGGRRLEVFEYGDPGGFPLFFFHGLIGSHHQAGFVAAEAARRGLRVIAPNRPGVGRSDFERRKTPLDSVADVEAVAGTLGLGRFGLIGISGGTPYALAALHRLRHRAGPTAILSGMGPTRLRGALRGMPTARRLALTIGARRPRLAVRAFQGWAERFEADPEGFLDRFVAGSCRADRVLFRRPDLRRLFLGDLHQVFRVARQGPEGLAQELRLYRDLGFPLRDLPSDRRVVLWQGLDDDVVPPAMAYALARQIPNAEAHFVPGGHFVAVDIADRVMERFGQLVNM